VLWGDINDIPLPADQDLVLVMGVDYFFDHLDLGLEKLRAALGEAGHILFQRNVFLENLNQTGRRLSSIEEVFAANPFIRNMVSSQQWIDLLDRYFDVVDVEQRELEAVDRDGEFVTKVITALCCTQRGQ